MFDSMVVLYWLCDGSRMTHRIAVLLTSFNSIYNALCTEFRYNFFDGSYKFCVVSTGRSDI